MQKKETWFAVGDINAFFGLSLDNIAGLVLIVGILAGPFGVPADFCLRYMVPGTAIGVLVGDLLYFGMALWLARKTKTWSVTAMPLGLDTPSIFGMGFFVLGPSFLKAKNELGMSVEDASIYMWEIGICCVFFSGIFKVLCSFGSSWARNGLPRAGLLGSLAAIALVIISFLPLLDILSSPIVGFTALAIVLTALIGQVKLPGRIPGVVGALIVAGGMHYLLKSLGYIHVEGTGSQIHPLDCFLRNGGWPWKCIGSNDSVKLPTICPSCFHSPWPRSSAASIAPKARRRLETIFLREASSESKPSLPWPRRSAAV